MIKILAALLSLGITTGAGANALDNGGFDSGSFTAVVSSGQGTTTGGSAAAGWAVWNSGGTTTTTTQLLASTDTLADGSPNMLHVLSDADYTGVYQFTSAFNYASVDLRVVSGSVFFSIGAPTGAYTIASLIAPAADGWQHVSLQLDPATFGYEVTIYGLGEGTDFYADNAYAGDAAPVPEPGEWAMMLGGLGVIGGAAKRKRCR